MSALKWTTDSSGGPALCASTPGAAALYSLSDVIATLKANPEPCAEVVRALMSTMTPQQVAEVEPENYLSSLDDARRQAERERDEVREKLAGVAVALRVPKDYPDIVGMTRETIAQLTALSVGASDCLAEVLSLRAHLAKMKAVVHWVRCLDVDDGLLCLHPSRDDADCVCGPCMMRKALRALDATPQACAHKTQRCENDRAVCVDCGAVNHAVTGIVDWRAPQNSSARHRCTVCGCLWRLQPPTDVQPGGSWSLWDAAQKPGTCCDNVAMGSQIVLDATPQDSAQSASTGREMPEPAGEFVTRAELIAVCELARNRRGCGMSFETELINVLRGARVK